MQNKHTNKQTDQKYPEHSGSLLTVFLVSSLREQTGVVKSCCLLCECVRQFHQSGKTSMVSFKEWDCPITLAVYIFLMACGAAYISMELGLHFKRGYYHYLNR